MGATVHIAEGIITGKSAVLYTGIGVALVALGASRMKRFVGESPEKKPLLGMGGALIFFFSLIPIPAFTGTCSHPCGTPLVSILLGPVIGMALTGISLLLQAAFFGHGGFATWGANVTALGFFGCFFGWGSFRAARRMGLPLWLAGFAGGLAGDLAVYAASGMILATTLANAPHPQYSLEGYLAAIYAAYLPTQLPIALGEALVTGLALHYAFKQRPEVLCALGVTRTGVICQGKHPLALVLWASLALFYLIAPQTIVGGQLVSAQKPSPMAVIPTPRAEDGRLKGMDEAVNERLAESAGLPPREPFLHTEAMGDLWNTLLLLGGGVCGFVLGRWWHLLWGKSNEDPVSVKRGSLHER